MSLSLILFILGVIFVTSLISGIVGMVGDALLLVILSFAMLPIPQMVLLYATALFFACASRAYIHRKQIQWPPMEYYLVGLLFALFIFGALPGVAIDQGGQDMALGVAQALLGIAFFVPFFSGNKLKLDFTRKPQALLAAVLTVGFKAIDNNGFLLNLFFQDIRLTRFQVIGTKAAALLLPFLAAFLRAGSAGDIPSETYGVCAAIIPVAFLGSYLGMLVLQKMTDKGFYKTTRVILWIMGAICLWQASSLIMQALPEIQAGSH